MFLLSAGELVACPGSHQQRIVGEPAPPHLRFSLQLLPDAGATFLIHVDPPFLPMRFNCVFIVAGMIFLARCAVRTVAHTRRMPQVPARGARAIIGYVRCRTAHCAAADYVSPVNDIWC
jgi:hypothetical protein